MIKTIAASIYMLFCIFVLYAMLALPLTAIIYALGRKRANWLKRELILILLPCLTWSVLVAIDLGKTKSLANLIEIVLCGAVGGLILLPRLLIKNGSPRARFTISTISALSASAIAAAIYFLMPTLPE